MDERRPIDPDFYEDRLRQLSRIARHAWTPLLTSVAEELTVCDQNAFLLARHRAEGGTHPIDRDHEIYLSVRHDRALANATWLAREQAARHTKHALMLGQTPEPVKQRDRPTDQRLPSRHGPGRHTA